MARALRRARPHPGAAAPADRQAQGIEQDGFARAGFAGQHIQARREFQRGLFDQDDVTDSQRGEHNALLIRHKE